MMEHLQTTLRRLETALEMSKAMGMDGHDICFQIPFHEAQRLVEAIKKDRDQKDMGF